jgi:hypothetical protein
MFDYDVCVLLVYILGLLVLEFVVLVVSAKAQVEETFERVMSSFLFATKFPILGWILVVLPCCLAMDPVMPRMDPLKRIPDLTQHNYKEWRFQILLAFKTAGVVCHGLYTLCARQPPSRTGEDASSPKPSSANEDDKSAS